MIIHSSNTCTFFGTILKGGTMNSCSGACVNGSTILPSFPTLINFSHTPYPCSLTKIKFAAHLLCFSPLECVPNPNSKPFAHLHLGCGQPFLHLIQTNYPFLAAFTLPSYLCLGMYMHFVVHRSTEQVVAFPCAARTCVWNYMETCYMTPCKWLARCPHSPSHLHLCPPPGVGYEGWVV